MFEKVSAILLGNFFKGTSKCIFFVEFNVVVKPIVWPLKYFKCYLFGKRIPRDSRSSDLQTELIEKIWYNQNLFLLVIIIFINSHKILSLDYIIIWILLGEIDVGINSWD